MKELMKKFKEIQTQNFSLINENQSLKKNISALIKTARVEINRKDEEISNLHQRLSEFPHFRNNHKTARTFDTVKTKDLKSRSPHLDDCSKTDHRAKSDVSKDVHHSTSLPNLEKEGKSHSDKGVLHIYLHLSRNTALMVFGRVLIIRLVRVAQMRIVEEEEKILDIASSTEELKEYEKT